MTPDYKELRALLSELPDETWEARFMGTIGRCTLLTSGKTSPRLLGDMKLDAGKFAAAARNALPGLLDDLDRQGAVIASMAEDKQKLSQNMQRLDLTYDFVGHQLSAYGESQEERMREIGKLHQTNYLLRLEQDEWTREREKLVAVLKATRQLMGGLHTLGWARMDSGPEAPCCISHGEFKHLLYKLQQPVDEALKDCAGIEEEA